MSKNLESPDDDDDSPPTHCRHMRSIGRIHAEEVLHKKEKPCEKCKIILANRWLCLHCLFVGCGAKRKNHAAEHSDITHHQLQIHLKNFRIWCHQCDVEIRPKFNIPPWNEGDSLLRSLAQMPESPVKKRPASPPKPDCSAESLHVESIPSKARSVDPNLADEETRTEIIGNCDNRNAEVNRSIEAGGDLSLEIDNIVKNSAAHHNQPPPPPPMEFCRSGELVDDSKSSSCGRRLVVPAPGPDMISVADDVAEKHSLVSSNSSKAESAISRDSALAASEKLSTSTASQSEEIHVRKFFITGRQYNCRERPIAILDSPTEFGASSREEEPFGLTGLRNLGNTCYMNAALQALSNTTPLTEYLLNCRPIVLAEHNRRCLATEYTSLIAEVWNERRPGFLVPYNVLSWVRMCHPSFRGYQQQDAQEFLRYFLDQLHEDLRQPVYPWECQGEERSPTSSMSSSGVVRGRESTESTDENGDISSSSTSSRSSGMGVGQSDESYRTCDSGWISDQEGGKRTRTESSPAAASPKRKRATLSESVAGSINISRSISPKNVPGAHRRSHIPGGGGDSSDFSDAKQELSPVSSKRMTNFPKRKALRYGSGVPRKKPIHYRSIVSDIFDGKLLSSVQCLTCNTVSETRETFQDLSIPIPGRDQVEALRTRAAAAAASSIKINESDGDRQQQHLYSGASWWDWFLSWFSWMGGWMSVPSVTLEDCLAAFFSADDLKGDDMYSCDGCKKLRNGVKCCYLLQLPEVLCIHLKRFRHELMYSTKISTRVTFPLDGLDLRPFLHRNAVVGNGEHIYDLYAVICHYGSVEGGHYTAFCLNSVNGRWYEYDDQCVTEVDAYMVQSAASAYVLFYRKRSDRQQIIRDETANLLRPHGDVLPKFFISQEWINRFNHLSDPGPISNFDFLCPHGCIDPKKHDFLPDLYAELPSLAWQYLYKKFGGGPVCNKLLHCVDCNQYYRRLKARRDEELETFYRIERAYKQEQKADCFYALSMKWFRKWEAFVMNRQEEPPGPIDNSDIVSKKTEKNEFARVKQGSNYVNVYRELWEFYYDRYGGGPEILMTNMWPMSHSSRHRLQESLDDHGVS